MTIELIGDLSFDYAVLAGQIAHQRRIAHTMPDQLLLNAAITSVRLNDKIDGASTLTIELADPDFEIAEFFDIDENGRVDPIDLNYPLGGPNWWRLTQMTFSNDAGLFTISLTFMERPAVYLLHHHGPKKSSRASVTRAGFLKLLVETVKADTLIFRSRELHKRQPISQDPDDPGVVPLGPTLMSPLIGPYFPEPPPPPPVTPKKREEEKRNGIPHGTGAKIKGATATDKQIDQVNRALDVAYNYQEVDQRMVEALVCAGIGESAFQPIRNQLTPPSPYHGVFQGHITKWDINDTEGMAKAFLFGGKGFQPETGAGGQAGRGGAYYWRKKDPGMSPGEIALRVEGSGVGENFYQKWINEARELIRLYGGGFTGGTTTYHQQYNFQIGSDSQPNETYWDGMNRLAQEVKWRLFIDGRTVYFDPDTSLIRQQPALVLEFGNPRILRWSGTWDEREIASEMTLDLICQAFEFRAGQVWLLQGFGPLSKGSTARLPGRWLVAGISRQSGAPYSHFTLVQPQRPTKEPATTLADRKEADTSAGLGGIHDDMTAREVIDTLVLPIGRKHNCKTSWGTKLTSENVETVNAGHDRLTTSGNVSMHAGPSAQQWAVDMSNGNNPTPQMDALAEELREIFDMGQFENKKATRADGFVKGNLLNARHKAGGRYYDFQLIYRTTNGGDHYDHVHFGVRFRGVLPNQGYGDAGGGT